MDKYLLCFHNKKFSISNSWLKASAKHFGNLKIISYTDKDFYRTEFCRRHSNITCEKFGAGFYIWKPYYIKQVLENLKQGDLLLYIDSGQVLERDPSPLYELCRLHGIVLFANSQGFSYFNGSGLAFDEYNCYWGINQARYWCKGEMFRQMQLDSQEYWETSMVDASIMLFRKDERSLLFIDSWLNFCSNRQLISWDASGDGRPEIAGFRFHIYDQSIISVLAKKYGLELFRCPSQYGNHFKMPVNREQGEYLLLPYTNQHMTNSSYSTITWHHRYKHKPAIWRLKNYIYREWSVLNAILGNPWNKWFNKSVKPYKTL